jgi:hypothetical protein
MAAPAARVLAETGGAPAPAGGRGAPAHLGARDCHEEDPLAEALVGEGADGVDAAGDEGRGVEVVGEERVVLLLHVRVALRDAPCTRDGKGGRRGPRHAEGAGRTQRMPVSKAPSPYSGPSYLHSPGGQRWAHR